MGPEELPRSACLLYPRTPAETIAVPVGGDIIEVIAPFKEKTTAGRLLEKRGDGGYMIIMQTEDAKKRRQFIESNNLAKVIWSREHGDVVAVQYHPKGIKGSGPRLCAPRQLLMTSQAA
jgi:hypothetical protein